MGDNAIVSLEEALLEFVNAPMHQSQEHIKPLHWHIACRLVIEGGFHPTWVTPTPPLRVEVTGTGSKRRCRLFHDENASEPGEQIVLGALKTKSVDVVVSTKELGPCLAVSVKGSLRAFRNLTNRMEEAAGDCTNLHMSYPTLVYGFLHIIKANREADVTQPNDIAVFDDGDVSDGIKRYHDAIARLAGRSDVRDETSRYEAIALALIDAIGANSGNVMESYPPIDSLLRFEHFFHRLYELYDLRYVYAAPSLKSKTQRFEWDLESPALMLAKASGFNPRTANA